MKTGKRVTGKCSLCIKGKEGDVVQVNGIAGLKPMTLCTVHIMQVADLENEPEMIEEPDDGPLFNRASA